MVTLPRLLALALVGSLVGACSSRDTLLEGGAAGAALGGTQASSGNAGAAPSGGKTADGGAPQGAGGSTAGSAAGGPAERGGAGGEVSGGAGTGGAGGAASCALPEGCPCSDLTTLDDCTAQADCHPVFVDPNTCGCGLNGCCARFSHCANGATGSCTFPEQVTCAMVMPFCDSPAYVNSFENGCYDGCVRSSDCTPLP